ncbi:MAG: nitrilase-related carbon-nitrogen hydrolase [Conexivisphaerales archaeon]
MIRKIHRFGNSLGDASELKAVNTELGKVGILICGENTNPLARYSLIAQGEQIHIATYPPAWPTKRNNTDDDYRLGQNIKIRAAAHSFEGKLFTIAVSSLLDDEAISYISRGNKDIESLLMAVQPPETFVVGPNGRVISEELIWKEGIVYAQIDLSKIVEEKQYHDIASESYNRFDTFRFEMDARKHEPVFISGADDSTIIKRNGKSKP